MDIVAVGCVVAGNCV